MKDLTGIIAAKTKIEELEKELRQTKEELKHSRNWEKEQHERHTETVNDLLKQRGELRKEIEVLKTWRNQDPGIAHHSNKDERDKKIQELLGIIESHKIINEDLAKESKELLEENNRLKESFTPSIPPLCVCKKKESSSVVTYCDGNCL